MITPCEAQYHEAQPALIIRTHTPVEGLPQVIGQVYAKLDQYLGELGEALAGEPYVAYHNLDMQNLDVELGFPVAKMLPGKGEIQAGEIPAGRMVSCLYTGPYSEMGKAYEEINQWIKDHGYEATGLVYEHYLTGPETPQAEHQTRIVFVLK
ncbi:MAG: GyrI-like domain-containing protein [Chloroflexi bacterium]|nr:GyrI-like domain-containing protein [Chloroflexota bacterium]